VDWLRIVSGGKRNPADWPPEFTASLGLLPFKPNSKPLTNCLSGSGNFLPLFSQPSGYEMVKT